MLIAIVGDGLLPEVLARAAERAGHSVIWTRRGGVADAVSEADIAILAGPRVSGRDAEAVVRVALVTGSVVVDAAECPLLSHPPRDALVVRAFASLPADALAAALGGRASPPLAIPLAGDDQSAKALVGRFMHSIGVEPFDVGALGAGDVLQPGGALWGRALTPVELLEQVGELSGDG